MSARIPDDVIASLRPRLADVAQHFGVELKRQGKELAGRCPFHDDGTPSFRVSADGTQWVCPPCKASGKRGGGDVFHLVRDLEGKRFTEAVALVAKIVGVDLNTVRPAQAAKQPTPKLVATYRYEDAAGVAVGIKERWEPGHDGRTKRFVWKHPDGKIGKPAAAATLYRMPEVVTAISDGETVHIVEGEKCADAMARAGLVATTNEDGAGKWTQAHAEMLRGARVVVLPDADDVGRKHAQAVAASLAGVAASVRVVEVPGLAAKGDVADYLEKHTADELRAVLAPSPDAAWNEAVAQALADLVDAGVAAKPEGSPRRRFFTRTGRNLIESTPPPTPWLVRGVLVAHGVQAIAAEPKNAKTWISVELAMAVASSSPAFGHFPTIGAAAHVALFQAEDAERSTRAKLRSLGAWRGFAADELAAVVERVHVESLGSANLRHFDDLACIVASVRALHAPIALLVLDPLRDLHDADENDSKSMAEVAAALRALRTVLGCAVLFVHHSSKTNENTGKRRGGQRMRGSSVLHGAVDGGLYLDAPTGNLSTEWTTKAHAEIKGARSAGAFTLTLRVLEDDEHDEAVRVSWEVDDGATGLTTDEKRAQEAVLRVLHEQWIARPDEPVPMGEKPIRTAAKLGMQAVQGALLALARAGLAERTFKGERALGWIYRPPLDAGEPSGTDAEPSSALEDRGTGTRPFRDGSPVESRSVTPAEGGSELAEAGMWLSRPDDKGEGEAWEGIPDA
jgi:hypothetical protein